VIISLPHAACSMCKRRRYLIGRSPTWRLMAMFAIIEPNA